MKKEKEVNKEKEEKVKKEKEVNKEKEEPVKKDTLLKKVKKELKGRSEKGENLFKKYGEERV